MALQDYIYKLKNLYKTWLKLSLIDFLNNTMKHANHNVLENRLARSLYECPLQFSFLTKQLRKIWSFKNNSWCKFN
jgi:hypothetical protein